MRSLYLLKKKKPPLLTKSYSPNELTLHWDFSDGHSARISFIFQQTFIAAPCRGSTE
jgi:hypothetical protein